MLPTAEPNVERAPGRPKHSSRWLAGAALGGLLLTAAACGSSGASSPTSTKAGSGSAAAKPIAVVVKTSPRGSLGSILVDQSGRTLYRYSRDGIGTTSCTGGCAVTWPPLLVANGTVRATGAGGISASELGTIVRPGGAVQVTFKGMPLYRFSGDTTPTDTNGQGVDGSWFVVSPSASTATPPSTDAPATTAPPATAPPSTSPPVTAAPATSTPATAPPATAPPVTSPPATAPPATAPPVTSPPATSPPATQPSGGYGY